MSIVKRKLKKGESKRIFLCLGESLCGKEYDIPKCIYSSVEIVNVPKPLYARSSKIIISKELKIFCNKKIKIITKYITECDEFCNCTLDSFKNVEG